MIGPERQLFFMLILGSLPLAEPQFGPSPSYESYPVGGVATTDVSFTASGYALGLGATYTRAGGAG